MAATSSQILSELRVDSSSWSPYSLLATAALLALHASHKNTPETSDLPQIHYLLDQEIRYHLRAFWAMWAGRYTNYDASICVDVHYLYYIAGGMEQAANYTNGCTVKDLLEGAGEGRKTWWRSFARENEGDEQTAFEGLKAEVLERIKHDRKYGISDEKVVAFVEQSWRSDTARWRESLYSEDNA
ncbi:hypothetical protein LshimejAT787_1900800 [Lyophyllum shimeji]|uniref:Uncharacterized protein n=1 Tax=Lyophyllum shimeji TaxID=47721 RepID=A0A9P3Q1C5_LYOSH|nr:hypothetical protein LshimejAT787_1900800 [Lyophyllum shimeji]